MLDNCLLEQLLVGEIEARVTHTKHPYLLLITYQSWMVLSSAKTLVSSRQKGFSRRVAHATFDVRCLMNRSLTGIANSPGCVFSMIVPGCRLPMGTARVW
jgi:hypothetical protein